MKARLALLLLLVAPLAGAAEGSLVSWTPDDEDDQWRVGYTQRACFVTGPDGSVTHSVNGATVSVLAADDEDCVSFLINATGTHRLSWEQGGAPLFVEFEAWGAAPVDWEWWLQFTLYSALIVAGMAFAYWFLMAFATVGWFSLFIPGWPFDLEFALIMVLLGLFLEFFAFKVRERRLV